jgi:hypothetical protein
MKNTIYGYDMIRKEGKGQDTVVLHFNKRIPPLGYGAKKLAKMLRKYHKKHQK